MAKYKDHNNDKYIIAGVAVVLIIIGLIAVWVSTINPQSQTTATSTNTTLASSTILLATTTDNVPAPAVPGDLKTVTLAKCLAQKKITMYGAAWCTHCQDQKKAFGSAWQYVPYVECPDNVQLCISKQIQGYPTWMKSAGAQLEGFIELKKLADWAGCEF